MAEKTNALILVIVSNPSTREILSGMLEGTGFTPQFAETAEDGLQKAAELLPNVILLDIDLEALNSFDTCRRIRSNRLLEGIPIVMLCERENRDTRAAGMNAGADDFLEKPFDGLELMARLRSLSRLYSRGYLTNDLTRFTWIVEHAHEGYLLLDQSGNIHYANERALSILNVSDDYFGLPFVNAVEHQYTPEPIETWRHWLNEPESCFLVQPESPTARAVWVVLEGLDTPFGPDQYRIVRLRDVTERMTIYQDMRKFHTVIAHKLRTPMSMMMTSISIIKSQLDNLSEAELRKMLGSAIKGTDRLASEVRAILTYIDAPLALNVGNPAKVSELYDLVHNLCAEFSITKYNILCPDYLKAEEIGLTIDALEMILHELLLNSRKFHPTQSPSIEISLGKIEAGFVQLRVVDDGLTLSTEQMNWTWLPYFQSEKDFTGEIPGLGLGFPMVATLIWKSGGSLRLLNRTGSPGVIVDMKIPLESTLRNLERSASPFGK